MPLRSISVIPAAPQACNCCTKALSVSVLVEPGGGSALLKLALSTTCLPRSQPGAKPSIPRTAGTPDTRSVVRRRATPDDPNGVLATVGGVVGAGGAVVAAGSAGIGLGVGWVTSG